MENNEKVSIRIDLDGELAKRFQLIKLKMGVKSNSELVRILISREYSRLYGDSRF